MQYHNINYVVRVTPRSQIKGENDWQEMFDKTLVDLVVGHRRLDLVLVQARVGVVVDLFAYLLSRIVQATGKQCRNWRFYPYTACTLYVRIVCYT